MSKYEHIKRKVFMMLLILIDLVYVVNDGYMRREVSENSKDE